MAEFVRIPEVAWIGGHRPWKLRSELIWRSDRLGEVVVPEGFTTDFASVPRLPFVYVLAGGRASIPAILHDWLYDRAARFNIGRYQRKDADYEFLLAMQAISEPPWRVMQHALYYGTRVGGRRSFRKNYWGVPIGRMGDTV